MENGKIRIFIVDDHELVIDALWQLLGTIPAFQLIGRANNGEELLESLKEIEVDVILMDIRMPVMDGLEATERVKERYPDIKVLMLTMHSTRTFIKKATERGADGYISKNKGKEDFIDGINRVHRGEFVIIVDMDEEDEMDRNAPKKKPSHIGELSEREKEVLYLIVEGFTTSEIATKLYRSSHTIERHRKNIMSKLNAKNLAQMVKLAIDYNLCEGIKIS